MKTYFVVWEISIDAETPEDAAREALACQRDPGGTCTVFSVIDKDGEPVLVDLDELDQQEGS